jgi:site-specific DNA-methyltransferase (adenine-specific)
VFALSGEWVCSRGREVWDLRIFDGRSQWSAETVIHHGDLFVVLPTLEADSIDACVTDPPYGLGFMAKEWDVPGGIGAFPMRRRVETDAVNTGASRQGGRQRSGNDSAKRQKRDAQAFEAEAERWAIEVLRVLKPGAHLVAFGGTRTFHRLAAGIEDAGFEIRDCLSWLHGQGFPKSLNVGDGRGTALKPAWEPIILARKPTKGTVAQTVARYGTGAIHVDACRIEGPKRNAGYVEEGATVQGRSVFGNTKHVNIDTSLGRWPANVLLDEQAAQLLDEQTGDLGPSTGWRIGNAGGGMVQNLPVGRFAAGDPGFGDRGGASRFFYVAKPSREERDYGCHDLTAKSGGEATDRTDGSAGVNSPRAGAGRTGGSRNIHPTVKPVELMRWLVRLVTPPDGIVLDPFTGSGTTGMACRYEHRRFIGIEREADYVAIAELRIAAVAPLFGEQSA